MGKGQQLHWTRVVIHLYYIFFPLAQDVFFNGNIIFLLPLSDPLRLPLRAAGSSLKGKGAFKNDCEHTNSSNTL